MRLGSGFRVQGSGFRVQGSGFRVQRGIWRLCRLYICGEAATFPVEPLAPLEPVEPVRIRNGKQEVIEIAQLAH